MNRRKVTCHLRKKGNRKNRSLFLNRHKLKNTQGETQ
jgi:hypothetical protein